MECLTHLKDASNIPRHRVEFNLARKARKINSLDLTQRVKSVGVSMQQAELVALVVPSLRVLQ